MLVESLEHSHLAITRLLEVKSHVDDWSAVKKNQLLGKVTHQQIQDNINYLQARDMYHLWPEFVEFNKRLDATRGQSLLDVVPEFKPYV